MPATVDQIREWVGACDKLHGDICVPKPIQQQPPEDVPLWVIDTHQQCIVPGLSADRYLALSYVWPESRGFSASALFAPRTLLLDSASRVDFQSPGYLRNEEIAQRIPMVIKCAMELSHALGERYLWVDRLCIVQNDIGAGGTLSQVAKMGEIYAGAYLTIIAAAPEYMYSSTKALVLKWPSFRRYSSYYDHPKYYENGEYSPDKPSKFPEERKTEIISARYDALSSSRWATRGWTYQEQILCKRAVIFAEHGFFWDCQCCVWDGAHLVPGQDFDRVPLHVDMGKRFSTRWWPDFGFYIDLICPYNGRWFTYPQDAILGISGILNALEKSFPGGFIYGLPRLFLDHALLWQPFGTVHRRVDRLDDGAVLSSLPSWSWSGWQGFVDPWSLLSGLSYIKNAGCQYQHRANSWRTRSLVDWHLSIGDQGLEPVLEPRILDQYVDITPGADSNKIPEGWTSHPFSFTHAKDESIHFRHPIPLKEELSRQTLLTSPAFLVCSATTASLFPATVLKQKGCCAMVSMGLSKISVFEDKIFKRRPSGENACPIVVLQQPNGAFAGLLRLMTNDNIDKSTPFELIAISTGTAEAGDLRKSIEWKLFETGMDRYWTGNPKETFYYQPEWISEKGKYALLFDVSMAFNKEAAENEYVGQELDKALAIVDQRSDEKIRKAPARMIDIELSPLGRWFQARTEFLQERARGVRHQYPYNRLGQEAVCEFYNVLWIEHRDGTAYRRACGWVPKHIWEAHATGPVEVKLG